MQLYYHSATRQALEVILPNSKEDVSAKSVHNNHLSWRDILLQLKRVILFFDILISMRLRRSQGRNNNLWSTF
jgi:hypothetical protein